MTYRTEAEAKAMPCPIARIQGDADASGNVIPKCRGSDCILWRWRQMSASDPRFMGPVQREMQAMADDHNAKQDDPKKHRKPDSFHQKAVAKVIAEPWEFMIPDPKNDRGYCGLGGVPA